jgi:hypothetical protein
LIVDTTEGRHSAFSLAFPLALLTGFRFSSPPSHFHARDSTIRTDGCRKLPTQICGDEERAPDEWSPAFHARLCDQPRRTAIPCPLATRPCALSSIPAGFSARMPGPV